MKYRGLRKKSRSQRGALIFGTLFSAAIFLILTFCASVLLSFTKNPLGASGLTSFAVLLITGAISGFCTAKYKGECGILPSSASAVIFALILLGAGLIVSGGKIATVSLVNILCYVALAVIFAFLAKSKRRRAYKR